MRELAVLRTKTYSYLIDNSDKDKKADGKKTCFIKWKIKIVVYKHCLEATQFDIKTNQPEKNKVDVHSFWENDKGLISQKSQQRLIREMQSV